MQQTVKERIYEQLRAAERRKAKSKGRQLFSEDPEEIMFKNSSSPIDAKERLTDFSTEEVTELLYEEGVAKTMLGLVGQGKEANVYYARDFQDRLIAIKMFRINTTSHNFQSFSPRSKLTDTGKLAFATALCTREYENLHYMYEGGVRVPVPYDRTEFVFSMELLGDEFGPYPLLRNVDLHQMGLEPIEVLDEILDQLDIMFNKARMVHGDFSEHNLVMMNYMPFVIDVYQSERWHPNYDTPARIAKEKALPILYRDVKAIIQYFIKKYRVGYDPDFVYQSIMNRE